MACRGTVLFYFFFYFAFCKRVNHFVQSSVGLINKKQWNLGNSVFWTGKKYSRPETEFVVWTRTGQTRLTWGFFLQLTQSHVQISISHTFTYFIFMTFRYWKIENLKHILERFTSSLKFRNFKKLLKTHNVSELNSASVIKWNHTI
jgi:hypothetical protein